MTLRPKYEKMGTSLGVYIVSNRQTGAQVSKSTAEDVSSYELDWPTFGSDPAAKFATATNYGMSAQFYSRPQGFVWGDTSTQRRTWNGNLTPFAFPSPPGFGSPAGTGELSSLLSNAISAVLDEVKSQNVNVAVAYAERMEAAELVVSYVRQVGRMLERTRGKLIRKILTGRPKTYGKNARSNKRRSRKSSARRQRRLGTDALQEKSMADLVKEAGNFGTQKWLEFGFGFRPIYNDVCGTIDALAFSGRTGQFVVRKTRTNNRQIFPDATVRTFSGGLRFRWIGGGWEKQSVRAILRIDLQSPELATASALGMTNPAALAWELIPMSWLVDAFVPVGGWIGNLDALIGYSVHPNSCVAYKTSRVATWGTMFHGGINGWLAGGIDVVASEKWRSFQRVAPWPSSAPFPRFRPPSFKSVANAFANVQSILVQAMLGRAPSGRI